ncbi:GGDEF domain-containing protein [Meiothermus sp. QL-1]|uniref:GGDEF domain-containing protein n=1 Tax=Meiothermus sp. QL-1 TaxID=2058095 RepID=UPI001F1EC614|nr:GGDEF domain-containing protein [Meiothermus sp. QL-1]
MEALRDEDLKLAELLERMQAELEQPIPRLERLRADLKSARAMLEARNQALLRSRNPELGEEDGLTGLLDRSAFERALQRVYEEGEAFSLVFVEVDGFAQLAGRFGQLADEVLRRVGQLVRRVLRASDVAGRVGEANLALILRGISNDRAFGVCERLRVAVLKYPWPSLHPELRVTLSLGFASRGDDSSAQHVMERAQRFLAEAIEAGRNQTFPGLYY